MKEQFITIIDIMEKVDVEGAQGRTDGMIENQVAEVARQGGVEEVVDGLGDHSNPVGEIDPTDMVEETGMHLIQLQQMGQQ